MCYFYPPMESTRQQKVSRLLQKELGAHLQRNGASILPGQLITVTVVRISPDLSVAKVYLSIFPKKPDTDPLEKIQSHASQIRSQVGNLIRNQLRIIPEFHYYLDDSLDYIENIDQLLNEDE